MSLYEARLQACVLYFSSCCWILESKKAKVCTRAHVNHRAASASEMSHNSLRGNGKSDRPEDRSTSGAFATESRDLRSERIKTPHPSAGPHCFAWIITAADTNGRRAHLTRGALAGNSSSALNDTDQSLFNEERAVISRVIRAQLLSAVLSPRFPQLSEEPEVDIGNALRQNSGHRLIKNHRKVDCESPL
ncbi:hypothetical protein QQF64_009379 [Cirrhinus molitorella]|uniref:Uncharacterized protein n=1 Tax=Cirrhinus molitorella TaxID=172907 RepID=A0ABR3M100_9TELE